MGRSTIFVVVFVLAFGTLSARSATIAEYRFVSGGNSSSDGEPNSFAGAIAPGGALEFFPSDNSVRARADLLGNDETAAVGGGNYLEFAVAPDQHNSMDFERITFELRHTHNLETTSLAVRSSADSFATTIGTGSVTGVSWETRTVDLSRLLDVRSEITFRLYAWDTSNRNDMYAIFDSVRVYGEVTHLPEPSTMGIVAFGTMLLARRQRHRRALAV